MELKGIQSIGLFYLVLILHGSHCELPGLFSSSLCTSSHQQALEPWCGCKESLQITDDINAWCKSYAEFSSCVERGLGGKNKTTYLSNVFNKTLMDKRMKFLCREENIDQITECSDETKTCHDAFVAKLTSVGEWNEYTACKLTELLASCLWSNEACPVTIKHLLSRLADSYSSSACTKYFSRSVGEHCVSIRKKLYSDKNNMETCLLGAKYVQDCMNREALDSEHRKDKFYTLDIDRERILIYETFRCQNHIAHSRSTCRVKGKKAGDVCSAQYKQTLKQYILAIDNGTLIPVEGVCKFYGKISDCFKEAYRECKVQKDHMLALLCSAMPKSCPCPLKLEPGVGSSSSLNGASRQHWEDFFLKHILLLFGFMIADIF